MLSRDDSPPARPENRMDKKLIICCTILFCVFLISAVLFVNYYNEYHNLCRVIESGLSDTSKKKDLYERIVTQYEFMEFKIFSYEKKFPRFSRIVNKSFIESRKNKLSPYTVLSVIQVESNFDPFASSGVAYGLMQVNLRAWQDYFNIDKKKIYDIDYNIAIGCKILKHYLDKSGGDLSRALYLYNNGYGFHNKKYVPRVQNNRFSRKGR